MLEVELEELNRLTDKHKELLPKEFRRWSKSRQYEWLVYNAAHYRKARWERELMFSEYDCSAKCHEHLRFAYIISGWLFRDEEHARLPFIEIEPEEFIKFRKETDHAKDIARIEEHQGH